MSGAPARREQARKARIRERRATGTFTAGAVLAIALIVSIAGSLYADFQVRNAFEHHYSVDQLQSELDGLYQSLLDQETGLRGFLSSSGQTVYLQPYEEAEQSFDAQLLQLRNDSKAHGLMAADPILLDLSAEHAQWIAYVAQPLIAHPDLPDSMERQSMGKLLYDQMRLDVAKVTAIYGQDARAAAANVQSLLIRAAASTAVLILLFGIAAIVADSYRSRTQAELERERVVADTLQRAFLSGWDSVPHLRIGTAYVSSTSEAAIGGDLFDIHRIDAHRSLVLVADVSGKGIEAAVETAQVKYTIRALIDDYDDPGALLAKFNGIFLRSLRDLSSFVSIFAGIFDDRDWTLRYASAGHAPTFLRRGDDVEQLPVTGPLAGITDDAAFSSLSVALRPGDLLVLSTDGLTEARDSSGVAVDDDGVMRWVKSGAREPQALAQQLIDQATQFAGGRINDDLALLIVLFVEMVQDVTDDGRRTEAGQTDGGRAAPASEAEPL